MLKNCSYLAITTHPIEYNYGKSTASSDRTTSDAGDIQCNASCVIQVKPYEKTLYQRGKQKLITGAANYI